MTPPAPTPTRQPLHRRLRAHAPEFLRYLGVGVFNTLFGYIDFVVLLTLLNSVVPARFLYLTVIAASLIAAPINITVAYLGYKFFVFRTHGNYLREWVRCFAVYGTSMIPPLLMLSAIARALQSLFHHHAATLHGLLARTEAHLHGPALHLLAKHATRTEMAGYIAGAIVTGFSALFSFIGHKKITFRKPPA